MVGRMGFALVTGLRGFDIPQVKLNLAAYRQALQETGHTGSGGVYIRIPVYVADTAAQAVASRRKAPCGPIAVWQKTLPGRGEDRHHRL